MEELFKLAEIMKAVDPEAAEKIQLLAGRYDKFPNLTPIELQPAYKYIMYLKLIRGLDNSSFHYMKRKYLNTSKDIQTECQNELNKIISEDALKSKLPSSTIWEIFREKLKHFESQL